MTNIRKKLDGLFKKADETEGKYLQALERREEELIALQAELQEKEEMLKMMHKENLLGSISEASFDAEKSKVDTLQRKISEAQTELRLIETYKTEDVKAVLAELEATKKEYTQNERAEIHKIKEELLEAKLAYIEKMLEARKAYYRVMNPVYKIDALKGKLGLQQNHYLSDAHSALSMYSVPNGGYENLMVNNEIVHSALYLGQRPSQLVRLVSENKK